MEELDRIATLAGMTEDSDPHAFDGISSTARATLLIIQKMILEYKQRLELVPIMHLTDNTIYQTHENEQVRAEMATAEVGQMCSWSIIQCYRDRTFTAQDYIKNMQWFLGGAYHEITWRDIDVKLNVTDQHGNPWYGDAIEPDFEAMEKTINGILERKKALQNMATNTLFSIKHKIPHNHRLMAIRAKVGGWQGLMPTPDELNANPKFWEMEKVVPKPPPPVEPARPMTDAERWCFLRENVKDPPPIVERPEPRPSKGDLPKAAVPEKPETLELPEIKQKLVIAKPSPNRDTLSDVTLQEAVERTLNPVLKPLFNLLSLPKTLYLNAWDAVWALIAKEKPKWKPDISLRDVQANNARRFKQKSSFESLDELKEKGLLGKIVGNAGEFLLETLIDPVVAFGVGKGLARRVRLPKKVGGKAKVDKKGIIQGNKYFKDSQLATKKNEAHFWSGMGEDGVNTAQKIANKNGGVTLEMTLKKQGIRLPKWDSNNLDSLKIWNEASATYANQVSGEVRAILGSNISPRSVWSTIEFPALKGNLSVTKIISIDPVTKIEKIIFTR